MWFVNIDHWTLKLAYLALQKIKEDPTEKNNQVDIYSFKGKECSISRIIHRTLQWIHTLQIYTEAFFY